MNINQIKQTKKWAELSGFQKSVYEYVATIPHGGTKSYKEVAVAIGRPKAARAVGNALNKNPFAPDVPCHRIIKSDGSAGGFAFGTAKKEKLLLAERKKI